MSRSDRDERVPAADQPRPDGQRYDLDRALSSVVSLRARVPDDAYTAATLGTERIGSAVLIREDGLLLTVGYLVTEAEEVWLTTGAGRAVPGHVLGFDQSSGFGLVQALGSLDLPVLRPGRSADVAVGDRVVVAAAGGRSRALQARVSARQEFAGYWEYVLDEAIFTAPAHPRWSGAAVIGPEGDLVGIGSLQLGQEDEGQGKGVVAVNLSIPIDLLHPVLDDMRLIGRPARPARPWLGLFAGDDDGRRPTILGLAGDGPARRAGLRAGDAVVAVAGIEVSNLAEFFRRTWALGEAGVEVPLTIDREGDVFDVRITSGDRHRYLKAARLH